LTSTTSGLVTERGYSEVKDTGEVNKKGKNKQEKRKQVTRSKRKQVIRETHILTIYIAPNLQCLLGHIRPRRPHGVFI